ncbi:hypothetical protein A1QQ_17165 [Vibrio ordalii FF-167]|nr:hypothetical protein A1QQ_17165 [Vibrio ordalii FF-167]
MKKPSSNKNPKSIGIRTTTKATRVKEHAERAKAESVRQKTSIGTQNNNNREEFDWDVEIDSSGWAIDYVNVNKGN